MSPIPPPSTSSSEPPSPDSTTSSATDAGPQRNPARMVAFIVAILVVVLMTWYVLTDRHAPYTSRGTVSTWVTLIGPRVGGQVGEVFVHDNQQVRQGTPLFALDPRPFEVAVQQAEATLAQATQGIDASSAALAASQADVAQARVNLANTRLATARTLELEQQQLVSRADGDNARASVKTAEAQLRAALENGRIPRNALTENFATLAYSPGAHAILKLMLGEGQGEVAAMKQMHRRMLLEWLQIDPAARPDAAGRGTNPPEGDDASG